MTAFHFLNMLQDAVVDVTHSPWPYQAGRTDPRPPTEIPLPQVEATQGLLKLWFGDAANSVLELDPIAYEDFATPWQDRRPR